MSLKTILQGKPFSHPLHPAIVHIPIAAWSLSFVFDLFAAYEISFWLILIGLVVAVPTIATGFAEFWDVPKSPRALRTTAVAHMWLNILGTLGYAVQLFFRYRYAVSTALVWFNGIEFVFLGLSGYLGGRLVYRYRVGVRSAENPQRSVDPKNHIILQS